MYSQNSSWRFNIIFMLVPCTEWRSKYRTVPSVVLKRKKQVSCRGFLHIPGNPATCKESLGRSWLDESELKYLLTQCTFAHGTSVPRRGRSGVCSEKMKLMGITILLLAGSLV